MITTFNNKSANGLIETNLLYTSLRDTKIKLILFLLQQLRLLRLLLLRLLFSTCLRFFATVTTIGKFAAITAPVMILLLLLLRLIHQFRFQRQQCLLWLLQLLQLHFPFRVNYIMHVYYISKIVKRMLTKLKKVLRYFFV